MVGIGWGAYSRLLEEVLVVEKAVDCGFDRNPDHFIP